MDINIYAIIGFSITFVVGLINLHLRIQKNTILIEETRKDIEHMEDVQKDVTEVKAMIRELKGVLQVDLGYIKLTLERHDKKIDS